MTTNLGDCIEGDGLKMRYSKIGRMEMSDGSWIFRKQGGESRKEREIWDLGVEGQGIGKIRRGHKKENEKVINDQTLAITSIGGRDRRALRWST